MRGTSQKLCPREGSASVKPTELISSRDNPQLVRVRRLLRDGASYRKMGQVWLEGDHLLRAAVARGLAIDLLLHPASRVADQHLGALTPLAQRACAVEDALWRELTQLETPASMGGLVTLPVANGVATNSPTVVLDRIQDPGNVGSILRSAAAMGVRQILALKGTAALWSPKVLRAGMGAHFGLALSEGVAMEHLLSMPLVLVGTSSHEATPLEHTQLPAPCAWVFGHEGDGIAPALLSRCSVRVAIQQSGGEESLNVAAAAAICLFESQRQRLVFGCGTAVQ
jgi:RNA methyltransferase, TrmH family